MDALARTKIRADGTCGKDGQVRVRSQSAGWALSWLGCCVACFRAIMTRSSDLGWNVSHSWSEQFKFTITVSEQGA